MKMEELREISEHYIAEFNKRYRREFLEEKPFETPMTVILGQRGVGKTTLIVQYLAAQKELGKEVLYVPVDHILVGKRTLYEIAEWFQKSGGAIICFDEIHKYGQWSKELKGIYDTFKGLKVIASGSSALEVHSGSHDLSRRALVRALSGLSFREYLSLKLKKDFSLLTLTEIITRHRELAEVLIEKIGDEQLLFRYFQEYLQVGYYPYFLEYDREEDFYRMLEQSVVATIETDLQAVHPGITGASVAKIRRLMGFVAKQVPFEPTLGKLVTALEFSDQRTLKTYLKYLQDAGHINMLFKSGNRLAALEKPQKIYLNNSCQAYAFGGKNTNKGNVRETFFLNATKWKHDVSFPSKGDFNVDGIIFEVGGKNKTLEQIKGIKSSFLAIDDLAVGYENVVPLWLFGFLM